MSTSIEDTITVDRLYSRFKRGDLKGDEYTKAYDYFNAHERVKVDTADGHYFAWKRKETGEAHVVRA